MCFVSKWLPMDRDLNWQQYTLHYEPQTAVLTQICKTVKYQVRLIPKFQRSPKGCSWTVLCISNLPVKLPELCQVHPSLLLLTLPFTTCCSLDIFLLLGTRLSKNPGDGCDGMRIPAAVAALVAVCQTHHTQEPRLPPLPSLESCLVPVLMLAANLGYSSSP